MDNDYLAFLQEVGLDEKAVNEAYSLVTEVLPRYEDDPYEIRDSAIHGLGVTLTRAQAKDTYAGTLRVGDTWTEAGRYMNHSATPNTYLVQNGQFIDILLAESLSEGEELTVDYRDVRKLLVRESRGIITADNFSPRLADVIASAYESGFSAWTPNKGAVGSSYYAGMNFQGYHALMIKELIRLVGCPIVPNSMFFRVTNEDTEQAYIHSDRESGSHTCVVYLSEHDTPSGTAFYKHKPTGMIEMPSFEEMQDMGIFDQMSKDMVSRDPESWEQLDYVEGKYNRALIFHAPLFHSRYPIHGIGKTEEEGRLVWVCHFFLINGRGELY